MSRPCACCVSPRRSEIDAQIAAGVTSKAVAALVGLSPSQISRHKRKCLAVHPLSEADQIALWSQRAEDLWALSSQNGDQRAMVAALQTGLKSLQFQIEQGAVVQQAAQDVPPLSHSPRDWSEQERARVVEYLDWLHRPWRWQPGGSTLTKRIPS